VNTDFNRFLGMWRLVGITADGRIREDRGARPTGLIVYDASGWMAAQIQPDRPPAAMAGDAPTGPQPPPPPPPPSSARSYAGACEGGYAGCLLAAAGLGSVALASSPPPPPQMDGPTRSPAAAAAEMMAGAGGGGAEAGTAGGDGDVWEVAPGGDSFVTLNGINVVYAGGGGAGLQTQTPPTCGTSGTCLPGGCRCPGPKNGWTW
jgi:hypothetical protein